MAVTDVRVTPARAMPLSTSAGAASDEGYVLCELDSTTDPIGLSTRPLHIDVDELGGLDDDRGENVQVARVTQPTGSLTVAFRGVAYLLNDDGKTIETLKRS